MSKLAMRNEDILNTLLWLLSMKRPHGGAAERSVSDFIAREYDGKQDMLGNVMVVVGEEPNILFTAHMDTVHKDEGELDLVYFYGPEREVFLEVRDTPHPKAGQTYEIPSTVAGGKPWVGIYPKYTSDVLGADDGAGIAILLHMIRNKIPGYYLFTVGEEVGCVGMSYFMKENEAFFESKVLKYAIAFDRRGVTDIITHQRGLRMASDSFAEWMADQLDMGHTPEHGIYTDNAEAYGLIPEIINISVGYTDEHTKDEALSITYLDNLADAVLKVEWDKMPEPAERSAYSEFIEDAYDLYDIEVVIALDKIVELIGLDKIDSPKQLRGIINELDDLYSNGAGRYSYRGGRSGGRGKSRSTSSIDTMKSQTGAWKYTEQGGWARETTLLDAQDGHTGASPGLDYYDSMEFVPRG